jgi:hypothetical protein
MVLLFLLREIDRLPSIVFYRDPWFPRKYDFAQRIISRLELTVYDYPPIRTSMLYGKGIPAFVNEYLTSEMSTIALPKNIIEYAEGDEEKKFLCGVNFFTRPCGTFAFPWDVALLAHKDCDEDQIYGPVPLHCRLLYRDVGPDYIYPLKEWTHDDVWAYHQLYNVPYQANRYDIDSRVELEDKTFNSDYWPACIRCVDKRLAGSRVFCPKLKIEIDNVSGQVREFDWSPDYFGGVKNGA